jgi:hypothetical protein
MLTDNRTQYWQLPDRKFFKVRWAPWFSRHLSPWPLRGYGIARRIEQVGDNGLSLNQGTIYPTLLRLEQRGWIKAEWGISGTKRRAKF